MINEKEMTAPVASVDADAEQSSLKIFKNSIPDIVTEINRNNLRGGTANG